MTGNNQDLESPLTYDIAIDDLPEIVAEKIPVTNAIVGNGDTSDSLQGLRQKITQAGGMLFSIPLRYPADSSDPKTFNAVIYFMKAEWLNPGFDPNTIDEPGMRMAFTINMKKLRHLLKHTGATKFSETAGKPVAFAAKPQSNDKERLELTDFYAVKN